MIKKKKIEIPEFNTSALPDIIFMLLFFFMVVTVMKLPTSKVKIELPQHDYVHSQKEKRNAHYFFLANDKSKGFSLQINDQIIHPKSLDKALASLKAISKSDAISYLKIEHNLPMKNVNQVKRALQKAEMYRVVYAMEENDNFRN